MAVLLAAGWSAAPAAAEQHDTELAVDHVATYTVDAEAGTVQVAFTYVFENVSNELEFPGFFESLPVDATDVEARSGSRVLEIATGAPADGFAQWLVAFPTPLRPGATRDVTLSWRIADGDPTDDRLVTPGSVAFDAFAGGTPEARSTALVVEAPPGYESLGPVPLIDDTADAAAPSVFRLEGAVPYESVGVVLENAAELRREEVADEPSVTVASSVVGWSAEVRTVVATVGDELDRWFGHRDDPLEIRQRPAGADPARARDLDADLPYVTAPVEVDVGRVADELARAWLADIDPGEPWLVDGLAAAFADGVGGGPGDVTGPAAVVAPLVDQIGAGGVRAVVEALRDETISYPGAFPEPAVAAPDWRRLLDLFENVGGADATALFRAFVVESSQLAQLDARAATRADYLALAERAGDWHLPVFLREPMARWDFATFRARQGEVSDTIATRDGLAQWAADVELDLGSFARDDFETAEETMAAADAVLAEQADALEAFSEARRLVRGDRALLAWLGLLGEDPDGDLEKVIERWNAGEFAAATHDAEAIVHEVEGAVGRGTLRLLAPLAAVGLLAAGVHRLRRRAVVVQPSGDASKSVA